MKKALQQIRAQLPPKQFPPKQLPPKHPLRLTKATHPPMQLPPTLNPATYPTTRVLPQLMQAPTTSHLAQPTPLPSSSSRAAQTYSGAGTTTLPMHIPTKRARPLPTVQSLLTPQTTSQLNGLAGPAYIPTMLTTVTSGSLSTSAKPRISLSSISGTALRYSATVSALLSPSKLSFPMTAKPGPPLDPALPQTATAFSTNAFPSKAQLPADTFRSV